MRYKKKARLVCDSCGGEYVIEVIALGLITNIIGETYTTSLTDASWDEGCLLCGSIKINEKKFNYKRLKK